MKLTITENTHIKFTLDELEDDLHHQSYNFILTYKR
jgi:hypothetical protein